MVSRIINIFQAFKQGIQNLYVWRSVIWKDRDWDHYYIFQILKFKLQKQARQITINGNHTSAKRDAEIMMTCVRLIDRVQNEYYIEQYLLHSDEALTVEKVNQVYAQHQKAKTLLFKMLDTYIEQWWD